MRVPIYFRRASLCAAGCLCTHSANDVIVLARRHLSHDEMKQCVLCACSLARSFIHYPRATAAALQCTYVFADALEPDLHSWANIVGAEGVGAKRRLELSRKTSWFKLMTGWLCGCSFWVSEAVAHYFPVFFCFFAEIVSNLGHNKHCIINTNNNLFAKMETIVVLSKKIVGERQNVFFFQFWTNLGKNTQIISKISLQYKIRWNLQICLNSFQNF